MATARQPLLNFPSQTHQGAPVIGTSSHLLAALRKSALSTDPPNGLVVLSGHPAVYRLGTCAAVDRALAGEPVLYLAGANVFDPFLVGRLAKAARVAPARVLQQIHVSRAFTCHQMVRLVTDCLPSALRTYDARVVVLSGPLETLYDQSVPEQETLRLFRTMLAALQRLVQDNVQLVCVSPLPVMAPASRRGFLPALRAQAHRAIDVHEGEDGIWLDERSGAGTRRWNIPRAVWTRL
ncbi:MAG TPA: hypothetical protein VLS44_06370 [Nitrospira sp.]|nr:hypothetical protein [Nitrospira sp.]